jgi:hypothetical protein
LLNLQRIYRNAIEWRWQRNAVFKAKTSCGIDRSYETSDQNSAWAVLMTLGAIVVWAKALAQGSADEQTQSTPENDQETAGDRQQKPNRKP